MWGEGGGIRWLCLRAGMGRQAERQHPHLGSTQMNYEKPPRQVQGRQWHSHNFYQQCWRGFPPPCQGSGRHSGSVQFYTSTHQLPSWAPLGTWAKQANDMCPNMPARGQPLSHRSDVPSPRHGHLLLQSTTSVCCNTSVWRMAGQPDPGPFSSPEPTAQVHQEQLTSGAHATVPGNLLFLLARADVS